MSLIQNQFNKKDFEKIIPFEYEVDFSNPKRLYSKELETYFYELPLNYLEKRNPNSLNKQRKKGYFIKYKLIVTENQIDDKEVSFNFFMAKFYQNIDNTDSSLLNSEVSLNTNSGYKGITHLYDNNQELIFAKHITKSEKEANDEIYLDKDFRVKNNLLAKNTDKAVEVCETKTIGVYKDIYRVIRDQWGNIIGYQYVTTILLYTYEKEVCYIKWIPQYVEGNGDGLFSNSCEGGQICILDVTEDLGCNSNLCNESVPKEIKEAMLIFDSANIILNPEQYLWATENPEKVNEIANYLKTSLSVSSDSNSFSINISISAIDAYVSGGEVDLDNMLIFDNNIYNRLLRAMSTKEREIYDNELNDTQKYLYLKSAVNAYIYAEAKYPRPVRNRLGDAFKHTYWNALSTVRIGEVLTKKLTDAHEVITYRPDYPNHYKESEMDYFNNAKGRQLAYGSGKLYQLVQLALENGDLRYLNNLVQWADGIWRASDSSILIPTNQ